MELGGVKPTLPVTIICCHRRRRQRRRRRHPLPRKRALRERNLPLNFRCATMRIPGTCPAPGALYYPEMGMIISPCPRGSFTAGTMEHRRHLHHRRHRRDDGTSSHPILDHHDGHRDPGSCGEPPMPILLQGTTIQLRLSIRTCGALTSRTCSRSEMLHRTIPQVGILL